MIRFGDAARPDSLKEQRMSALSQKRTFAVQKGMSALPPKADIAVYLFGLPSQQPSQNVFRRESQCRRPRRGAAILLSLIALFVCKFDCSARYADDTVPHCYYRQPHASG